MIEFRMPSLGADMEAGTLVEWLVKPGDTVRRGDIIATVDTQKGLIDIEVFTEGKMEELLIHPNEKVPVGTLMARISDGKEIPVPKKEGPQLPAEERPEEIEKIIPHEIPQGIRASPLAKRIAKEKGIDLNTIPGTGEEGAITREDVEKAIVRLEGKAKKTASPETIRAAVAAAMSKSKKEIPHYYLETKIDMSRALAFLAEANKQRTVKQRLLPAVLFIRATAKALQLVPDLNGYYDNGLKKQEGVHIGFVVSLRSGGVMIPAVHDADKKTLDELMYTLNDIIPRARALNLRSSELSDSTITITSLGEGSADTVYGVIYPPQVAIVGFGAISEQPWAENGMLDVRSVITVTLSADHRATDGATGSRFLMALKNELLHPENL